MQSPFSLLYQLLFVDNQLKLQAKLLRRFATQNHTAHEDFKVVHNRTILRIDGEFKFDNGLFFVDLKKGFLNGIIHPVVDVKC